MHITMPMHVSALAVQVKVGLLQWSEVGAEEKTAEVSGLPDRRDGPRLHDRSLDVVCNGHDGECDSATARDAMAQLPKVACGRDATRASRERD